jgi:hypothetical protein
VTPAGQDAGPAASVWRPLRASPAVVLVPGPLSAASIVVTSALAVGNS